MTAITSDSAEGSQSPAVFSTDSAERAAGGAETPAISTTLGPTGGAETPVNRSVVGLDLTAVAADPAQAASLADFLRYAAHAILEKDLPNFFDGLNPAQRRLLLALRDLGARASSKPQKSARVTGAAAGEYHPVGDMYGVLVNLSQAWKVPILLTAPEGEWGPIESGKPSADRYTETRLSPAGDVLLFTDLPRRRTAEQTPHDIVPCALTYTDLYWEEHYLPARLPLLFLNGSNGIAVGLAQTFPALAFDPFLTELQRFHATGQITYDNLRLGYPTEPEVRSDPQTLAQALQSGHGSIRLAARWLPETNRAGATTSVVITNPPPGLTLNVVQDKFNLWRQQDPATPFSRCDNETAADAGPVSAKLRFICRRPLGPIETATAVGELYRRTGLVATQIVNMTALKGAYPIAYTLESFCRDWLTERAAIVQRTAAARAADLGQQHRRLTLALWLRSHMPVSTEIIKTAPTEAVLFQQLQQLPGLTPGLAAPELAFILEINLRQLSRLAEAEVNQRLARLTAELSEQTNLATDATARHTAIAADLANLQKQAPTLGIKNYVCPYAAQPLSPLPTPLAGAPNPPVPGVVRAGTTSSAWWSPVYGPLGTPDIILATAQGALVKISSRSVRTTPYTPDLVAAGDIIQTAFFALGTAVLLLLDGTELALCPKELLPYQTPIYPAKIAQLLQRSACHSVVPVVPIAKPRALALRGAKGETRQTPLEQIVSLRMKVVFPKPVSAALIPDHCWTYTPTGTPRRRSATDLTTGSLKRIGHLATWPEWGPFTTAEPYILTLSADRKSFWKTVPEKSGSAQPLIQAAQ